jgi:galactokinase
MNADRARDAFRQHFGSEPALLMRAPGRVNLIGEHTDYNDGFVLPCAIDRDTVVAAGPSADGLLRSIAADFGNATDDWPLAGGFAHSTTEWADYVRAVAAALADEAIALPGARLAIAGNVPLGSGLSSSAALEVAVGAALVALAGASIDPDRMAQIARRAENDYVGCQCGIMDQLIATRGLADHALLIDCRTLACRPVAIPPGIAVLIAHSGVRHAHADGAYNTRRAECARAAAHYGVAALRDLDAAALDCGAAGLDDIAYRRARHVVTENARTLAAAEALATGDLRAMGRLMAESHASMQDDFEITVPAIDRLVAIMSDALAGEGGARMTGGGFGGCAVALVRDEQVSAVRDAITRHYRAPDGTHADVFICKASDGAGPIETRPMRAGATRPR